MSHLVITIVGEDRPGIVESLAAAVADNGGNWLSSSMSNLAGQFAGIIEVAVEDAQSNALGEAIEGLPGLHIHSVRGLGAVETDDLPVGSIDVVGVDQPGIVKGLTGVLRAAGVNLLEFGSWTEPAPNSGDLLFRALAEFVLEPSLDLEALQERLGTFAEEMGIEIELELDTDED